MENVYENKITRKPSRFDMAINFYFCFENAGKYYSVFYYDGKWDKYYPFYDDKNKNPIIKESKSSTYRELINEIDKEIVFDLSTKLDLAKKRFAEIFGINCDVEKSECLPISYELKYSKTSNRVTIYKFYNYIISNIENVCDFVNASKPKGKVFDLSLLPKRQIVENALRFCSEAKTELIAKVINFK